jgi:predicted nucleic acid-binding protein
VEVESVAARALKGRLLKKKAYDVLLSVFAADLEHLLIVLPVSTALLSEAAIVARQYCLRASDALHLASVLRANKHRLSRLSFVASDKELVQAAQEAGLPVLNPEREEALTDLSKLRQRAVEDQ